MSNVTIDTNGKLLVEDAHITYRNFAGKGSQFNREGYRNFHVIIDDPEVAQRMQQDMWNVKFRQPRDEQDPGIHHIKVNVSFSSSRPPKFFVHDKHGLTRELLEEDMPLLDTMDIQSCDLIINPYHYTSPTGQTGVSAYLDTMHITLREDPFAHKYATIEE